MSYETERERALHAAMEKLVATVHWAVRDLQMGLDGEAVESLATALDDAERELLFDRLAADSPTMRRIGDIQDLAVSVDRAMARGQL